MRVEKEKRKVRIVCADGIEIEGFLYINPGERLTDSLNHTMGDFMAITESKVSGPESLFKAKSKGKALLLNKASVLYIEER